MSGFGPELQYATKVSRKICLPLSYYANRRYYLEIKQTDLEYFKESSNIFPGLVTPLCISRICETPVQF